MQNVEVYEYLNYIWKIKALIENKRLEKLDLFTIVTKITSGDSDGMPHGSGTTDKVGNLSVEIAAITEEIDEMLEDVVKYKREAGDFINQLDSDKSSVLYMIYLQDFSITDAAEELGRRKKKETYSYQWVSELRKRGIRDLEKIIDSSELYEKYKKIFKKSDLLDNN